jgi:hypothetical protein
MAKESGQAAEFVERIGQAIEECSMKTASESTSPSSDSC